MDYEVTGTWKYSPNIAAEKITETTSQAFMGLTRSAEGRELAIRIINNYNTDEQRNFKQISGRHAIPKVGSGKKLPRAGSASDEN